jgi:hypothetical protein
LLTFGFLVLNVCNHAEHYEMPCIYIYIYIYICVCVCVEMERWWKGSWQGQTETHCKKWNKPKGLE